MKKLPIFFAALAVVWYGCSCTSTVERANFVAPETREDYIKLHPDGPFNDLIREGEITRGMSVHEVIASWGMPHVYAVSRALPAEHWIYYIRDREALSMLIYTLTFENDTLRIWDIDQKRFTGQGIASKYEPPPDLPQPAKDPTRKQ
jgi:hypothetical protein